ncbi:MAG: DHHA1 domain-containing protein, partial [Pseudomonadota bacterium]
RQNDAVTTRLMSPDEAQKEGARALFGEKYGDEVRVVSLGHRPEGEEGPAGSVYSLELCGGTHVRRAGDIGAFVVTGEGASASGIRRIEALTGAEAYDYLANQDRRLADTALALKVRAEDVPARVRALMEERRDLERQLAAAKKQLAMGGRGGAENAIRDIAGVKLFARVAEGISLKDLRGLVDEGKQAVGSGIVAIAGVSEDGKAGIAVGVTDDLTGRFNAVDLVRIGSQTMGGKGGGGRPDMAQAGGPDASKAGEAVEAVAAALEGGSAMAAE